MCLWACVGSSVGNVLCLSAVPGKSKFFELGNPLLGHASRLGFTVELVLSSLSLHPDGKLRILLIVARDYTVTVRFLVEEQFIPSFLPYTVVRVPDKANLVQQANSFIGQSRSRSVGFELVLITLSLYPLGQRRIALIVMNLRNSTKSSNFSDQISAWYSRNLTPP
jgi:hypothetical protein